MDTANHSHPMLCHWPGLCYHYCSRSIVKLQNPGRKCNPPYTYVRTPVLYPSYWLLVFLYRFVLPQLTTYSVFRPVSLK